MPIPEGQLETWSHQGAMAGSKTTYGSIKNVLHDADSPYYAKAFDSFVQGSYGNDTNVWAESDVDIVLVLQGAFNHNITTLEEQAQTRFHQAFKDATYGYPEFKKDAIAWLQKTFGAAVQPGSKAIYIQGIDNRRDADVLPCIQYRRYHRFNSTTDASYVEGICFWRADGEMIVNYPKAHSANCTSKHQATGSWFKPAVRILKNMRNKMVEQKIIKDGLAPSYFLEGLLYNVPKEKFGTSYHDTITNSLNWVLEQNDRSEFVCANEQYYLLREDSPVTWREEECKQFLEAAKSFWNSW